MQRGFRSGVSYWTLAGPYGLPIATKLEYRCEVVAGSESAGDKLRCRKGNSPDRRSKVPKRVLVGKGCGVDDSQEVGLGSHPIERVRNSSLV